MHRKTSKKKRFHTRVEADETIEAFLDYCYGEYGRRATIPKDYSSFNKA